MPNNDISDKLAAKLLPKVALIVGSPTQEAINSANEQSYSKKRVIVNNESIPVPVFFNNKISELREQVDIFVFLDENNILKDSNSLNRIVEEFLSSDYIYAGIYTDSFNAEKNSNEYLPPFFPAYLNGRFVINNPVSLQSKLLPSGKIFKENLDVLYYFSCFHLIGTRYILGHLAEPIYNIKRKVFDLQSEINKLNE